MALFAIGDLHLSLGCDKPMDIFDGWQGYVEKLESSWRDTITEQDTIVIAGDVSWAMKLENTLDDFCFLESLPGKKILLKGNHDYWWSTMSKMKRFVSENSLNSIAFMHNNYYHVEGICVCGTRSWLFEPEQEHDIRVMKREIGRLQASLSQADKDYPESEKVVFLHYPPLFSGMSSPEIIEIMQNFGVKRCYYGHLHSGSIRWAVQTEIDGIAYKLISADAVNFAPVKINSLEI